MKPIYIEIDHHVPLMVMPEADAHMDGHPVLTYSYAIYRDAYQSENRFTDTDRLLTPDKKTNPDYMGTLTFEQPGKVFSYEADGQHELPECAVEEIIERITHHGDNPALWSV